MFKTIFTVKKIQGESTIYRAYFEDFDSANDFAWSEFNDIDENFSIGRKNHFDGSFCCYWIGDHTELWLDNSAWITDWPRSFVFHDDSGLTFDFDTYEDFQKFLVSSQDIAKS